MAFRFLGIGAAKCATTWTYRVLSQHPDVRFPGKKEFNFWTQKSVDEHLDAYRALMSDRDPTIAAGEISVSYAVMKERRIQRIHSHYPDLRLFLNVRHPVDRVCSRARMLLRAEGRTIESLSPADLDELVFERSGVLAGDYPTVLERWTSVFRPDQLVINTFEEVRDEPQVVLERLAAHLRLDPARFDGADLADDTRLRTDVGPMPIRVLERLEEMFAEPMRRFLDEYGIDYTGVSREMERSLGQVARTREAPTEGYRRPMADLAVTLGALKASGWTSVPVKEEIRRNAVARIAAGVPLFEGVLGYEHTVMPQLENALLAGHDVIFLGERGQAKTRMIRSLTGLLDEYMPMIAGSEINDDPFNPVSKHARDLVASMGDDTPIEWVHRDNRFGEKLATPDTSIADLIGEVDPIKVAEGRYLSDELTLHYGLVPRTNRGIFAINEIPDLAERIQVGLLNVLEERDVQIRGYKIRLPLDVLLVASANPEDYTNRGRIITPLKDRFGSQIRTHYPLDADTEVEIMRQEARPASVGGVTVNIPWYLEQVVATFSQLARASSQVNQRSGVSVRLSVSNLEVLGANALRRGLRAGESVVVPRVCDLAALAASSNGKIEIESIEEGREGLILETLVKGAVLSVFKETLPFDQVRGVLEAFESGAIVHAGDDVPSADLARLVDEVPALKTPVAILAADDASPAAAAAAVEFILEGLHLSKRLNKDVASASGAATYRGRN